MNSTVFCNAMLVPSRNRSCIANDAILWCAYAYHFVTVSYLNTVYQVFLGASVAGTIFQGYFFAFHLLNIVNNNQLLKGVIQAVTQNGECSSRGSYRPSHRMVSAPQGCHTGRHTEWWVLLKGVIQAVTQNGECSSRGSYRPSHRMVSAPQGGHTGRHTEWWVLLKGVIQAVTQYGECLSRPPYIGECFVRPLYKMVRHHREWFHHHVPENKDLRIDICRTLIQHFRVRSTSNWCRW